MQVDPKGRNSHYFCVSAKAQSGPSLISPKGFIRHNPDSHNSASPVVLTECLGCCQKAQQVDEGLRREQDQGVLFCATADS